MTIVTTNRHKVKLARREGSGAVYRTKHSPKPEALWRDVVAGAVFVMVTMLGVGVLLAGGLIVFG